MASFGYDYNLKEEPFKKEKLFRSSSIFLMKPDTRLSINTKFAGLVVTEYPVWSVINWHPDAPPINLIAGISLLADCMFRLQPQDKTKQVLSSVFLFPLKRRSPYIIQGIARTDLQSSIFPVEEIRYSMISKIFRR